MNDFRELFSNVKCPHCSSNSVTILQREVNIPYFGKIFETITTCSKCKFKHSSILSLENRGPSKQEFKVETEKDLEARVVKSQNCTIKIPELKLEITPKPVSEGYITNVEGLLNRIKKVMGIFKGKKVKKLLQFIEDVREGKSTLTIIFEDPSGVSRIFHEIENK